MRRRRQPNPSQNQKASGFIRIISGLWRGRKLPVHDAEGLRPTTDRVKETLFNWIAADVGYANCLDVFAGSGGLGFEAASRQAKKVTMLEMNPTAYKQLCQNRDQLKADNIDVVNTDALKHLEAQGQADVDLVFLDPPFRQGLLDEAITKLEDNGWLSDNALIYIETEKELALPRLPTQWQLHREKTAGQVSYRLYIRENG
ncbi:16S rRNA (guanine(966)-N(2))-methyltransferase RsmD [Vibrio sp. SCSIO 43136]|uniref:16S rRNA (guanine(966)-N(2))-methyltransferase RsmD n=1 Tax=Vibrio sp. SCSIO 43136 TaxID=2819101 RepID=UPI002075C0C5|nr:16S rRNA (guanine(966)-N(2))-methyltransferase RsmD [Vibrio sp. SCSIO 43136]USD65389.1 16S rRNA (guanine(966)-N(2))-methyltransferase RsmD [Vibrio sp. SCSIO 43136]